MSDCAPFRLYIGDEIERVLAVLQDELRRAGAQASTAGTSGSFSIPLPIGGAVRGTYTVQGKSLEITVNSRPSAVSCGTIESKMQDYILDAKAVLKNKP